MKHIEFGCLVSLQILRKPIFVQACLRLLYSIVLTTQNPDVDRTSLRSGANTHPLGTYDIEGVQPWSDFTLEKILECFGDVLLCDMPIDDFHHPVRQMEV